LEKDKALGEKDFGLKSGKTRIELNEGLAAIGQDQAGALDSELFVAQKDFVRGGVVLHLLPGSKLITPRSAFPWLFEPIGSDYPGQGGVGDEEIVLMLETLLHPNHIALALEQELRDEVEMLFVL